MKKFLKYSGIIVFSAVIIFFLPGLFIHSINYESRVLAYKPVENSFRIFNNAFYLYEWVPGLEKVEWVSGVPGFIGSKWKMVMVQNEKEYITTEELTAFENNKLFEFILENEIMTNHVTVRFTAKGETTEIISSNHITGKNIFWQSVFVFAQRYFAVRDQTMYNKLKEVIEKRS